jgi:hypothetical protein
MQGVVEYEAIGFIAERYDTLVEVGKLVRS